MISSIFNGGKFYEKMYSPQQYLQQINFFWNTWYFAKRCSIDVSLKSLLFCLVYNSTPSLWKMKVLNKLSTHYVFLWNVERHERPDSYITIASKITNYDRQNVSRKTSIQYLRGGHGKEMVGRDIRDFFFSGAVDVTNGCGPWRIFFGKRRGLGKTARTSS